MDFSQVLYGWAQGLLTWLAQNVLLIGDTSKLQPLKDYFYGEALGLAQFLVIVVAAIFVPGSLILMKIRTLTETLKVTAVIVIFGPYFFAFCDGVADFSASITNAVIFYEPPSGRQGLVTMPTQGSLSVPGFMLVAGFICIFGVILLGVMVGCLVASYGFRFLGLPMYALRPLGPKAEHWSDWTISIGVVTLITANPTAAFVFSLCKWMGDKLVEIFGSVGSVFSAVIFAFTPLLATLAVVGMFFVTKKVVSKISEGVRSWVHGVVQTTPKDRQPVSVEDVNRSFSSTLNAAPDQSAVTGPPATRTDNVSQGTLRQLTHEGGRALLVKAAASTNPIASAGMMVYETYGAAQNGVKAAKASFGSHGPQTTQGGEKT